MFKRIPSLFVFLSLTILIIWIETFLFNAAKRYWSKAITRPFRDQLFPVYRCPAFQPIKHGNPERKTNYNFGAAIYFQMIQIISLFQLQKNALGGTIKGAPIKVEKGIKQAFKWFNWLLMWIKLIDSDTVTYYI